MRLGAVSPAEVRETIRARPTELLIARYRVIPYMDRGGLLAAALEWARSPGPPHARGRLYVAPGGFGKTRFALELQLALEAEGWSSTFLSERNARNLAPGALADLMRDDGAKGVLLVIDYAEAQIDLLKRIADAAVGSGIPLRLVALARSAEGWWAGTQADASMAQVFEPIPHETIETPLSEDERNALFEAAETAFKAALADAGFTSPTAPAPDIGGRVFDRPLTVAMAAFLAARGVAAEKGMSVFERMFLEERRHWKRALKVERDNDPALVSLHRAAAQITLVQGATPDGAAALIEADRRAQKYGRPAADATLAALETLYGDTFGDAAFLRPIEPDLLGEHAAMAALAGDRDGLIDATLGGGIVRRTAFPGGRRR